MKFITENNIPNAKVVAMVIAGTVITVYLAVAPSFGLPMFDKEWMMQNIDGVVSGVAGAITAILTIVAYFKKPGPGDGIKEKPE